MQITRWTPFLGVGKAFTYYNGNNSDIYSWLYQILLYVILLIIINILNLLYI